MPDIEELQIEILTKLYDNQEDDPFVSFNTDDVAEAAKEAADFDVEESDIDHALNLLDEEFLVEHNPAIGSRGTISLRPRGVDELQRQVGGTFLEDNNQFYILSELEELDRENPGARWEGGDSRDELDLAEDVVDLNMWYLIEKGWVEVSRVAGTPTYTALKIDSMGRQASERFKSRSEHQRATTAGDESTGRPRRTEETVDVEALLDEEESVTLEFKETFLYDVYQEQPNTEVKEDVVEEV